MPWDLHFAGIPGPHHEALGQESQDFAAWAPLSKIEGVVLAVADGAGSHEHSREGARLASLAAVYALRDQEFFDEAILEGALHAAHEVIQEQSLVKSMGCTLALAVLLPTSWVAGVVGDAFVVVHRTAEDHHLVQAPAQGEFVNITDLLSNKVISPFTTSGAEAVLGASVSSDGLLQTSVSAQGATSGFWTPLVTRAMKDSLDLEAFLGYMASRDLITDDTTLLMGSRKPEVS